MTNQRAATGLPVLDLARLAGPPEDAAAFCAELREAAHDVGFFYLTGHGVPDALVAEVLAAARQLFALPEADKLAIAMVGSPHFRGYTRVGGELTQGAVDWREQIDIGPELPALAYDPDRPYLVLQGPNQWPATLPGLRPVMARWDAALQTVGLTLLRAWAQSLGAPGGVFDAAFAQDPATLIKIVRYPGRAEPGPQQGVGAHKDSGVLTLLLVEPGKGGLQVGHDGTWIDAPALEGAFIVNIGELLEVATEGYLKATVHRVVSPPEGQDRISVPYFFNPALAAAVPVLTLPADLAAQASGVSADPANPIYATYGENALKSRLRAHPDVAAAHHPQLVGQGTAVGADGLEPPTPGV